jgi:hypothetical protein
MKDGAARRIIDQLADRIGCHVDGWNLCPPDVFATDAVDDLAKLRDDVFRLKRDLEATQKRVTALEESSRPTCTTCGQKIQDGFREGDVEALAAAVRKADKGKR